MDFTFESYFLQFLRNGYPHPYIRVIRHPVQIDEKKQKKMIQKKIFLKKKSPKILQVLIVQINEN